MGLFDRFRENKRSKAKTEEVEEKLDRVEETEKGISKEIIEGSTLALGWYYSENKDEWQMAEIEEKDRATHLYIVGASGTGKSKFLEFLIRQDILKGNGFGIIDPHGDLVEETKVFLL